MIGLHSKQARYFNVSLVLPNNGTKCLKIYIGGALNEDAGS